MARSRHGGAAAAICRDRDGQYLGSSAVVFQGITDPMMLETYACREALALAEDLATMNICVASDCQEVVYDMAPAGSLETEVFCVASRSKVHANWHCFEASVYVNGRCLSDLRDCRYMETCSHLLPDGG